MLKKRHCVVLSSKFVFNVAQKLDRGITTEEITWWINTDAECFTVTAYTIGPPHEDAINRQTRENQSVVIAICYGFTCSCYCKAWVNRRRQIREPLIPTH